MTKTETIIYDHVAFVLDIITKDGDTDLYNAYDTLEKATAEFERLTSDSHILKEECNDKHGMYEAVGLILGVEFSMEECMISNTTLRKVIFE